MKAWMWVLVACVALPAYGAPETWLEGKASLEITDAGLTMALNQLKDHAGIVARVEGAAPEKKLSLKVEDATRRELLDSLGALYGVGWELRGTMVVFSADPMARRISVEFQDADAAAALQTVGKAAGTEIRLSGMKPTRKASLRVQETPARQVIHAVAALYGLAWREGEGGGKPSVVQMGARVSGDEMGDLGGVRGVSTVVKGILNGRWGEVDPRYNAVMSAFLQAIPRETRQRMEPGKRVEIGQLTPELREMALEIAQRAVLANAASALRESRILDVSAALSGQGVTVGRTANGRMVELAMPDADGRPVTLCGISVSPGR